MVSLNPVRSAAQRVGSACNGDWSSDVPSRKCDATLFLRLPVCFPCYNSGPCPSWFVGHSTLGLDEGGPWVGIGWSEGSQDTWEQAGSGNGLGLEGRKGASHSFHHPGVSQAQSSVVSQTQSPGVSQAQSSGRAGIVDRMGRGRRRSHITVIRQPCTLSAGAFHKHTRCAMFASTCGGCTS